MAVGLHRHTVAMIDKEAIFDNIQNELDYADEDTEIFAVVKANAYGHGAVQTAQVAREAGATGFCVALIDEALELREAGLREPILVLGLVDVRYVAQLAEKKISVTVSSIEWLRQAEVILLDTPIQEPLRVHLAVDTGMGRIGFTKIEQLTEAESFLNAAERLHFEGIYTHFATADEVNHEHFNHQEQEFKQFVEALDNQPRYIHSANSATALWHKGTHSNLIRFGIGMYGLNPSGRGQPLPYKLRPALSLLSEIVYVKQIEPLDKVGYGATYSAEKTEWIATIPVGYADGWSRSLQSFEVLVEGHYCEIVGRVCMDQFMIRLPKEFPIGTEVTLIGKNNGQQITCEQVAEKAETINYEILCRLSERIPRVYN